MARSFSSQPEMAGMREVHSQAQMAVDEHLTYFEESVVTP